MRNMVDIPKPPIVKGVDFEGNFKVVCTFFDPTKDISLLNPIFNTPFSRRLLLFSYLTPWSFRV